MDFLKIVGWNLNHQYFYSLVGTNVRFNWVGFNLFQIDRLTLKWYSQLFWVKESTNFFCMKNNWDLMCKIKWCHWLDKICMMLMKANIYHSWLLKYANCHLFGHTLSNVATKVLMVFYIQASMGVIFGCWFIPKHVSEPSNLD